MSRMWPGDYINKIICGDCIEVMKEIPQNSIDLVVTSPPYDNLRNYKGYTFEFERIADILYFVMKVGGVIVWVVNDATIKGSETGTSFKQALYFKEIGFNLHDTMIYAKNNPVPQRANRYQSKFEFMFIFSKSRPKTFNPLLIDKKYNKCGSFRQKDGTLKYKGMISKDNKKYLDNIWYYTIGTAGKQQDFGHPAQFPEQLANDHIISWCNENDIVLDPMCGSGTTCKMAKLNNRKFIGIDISQEYCNIVLERIKNLD